MIEYLGDVLQRGYIQCERRSLGQKRRKCKRRCNCCCRFLYKSMRKKWGHYLHFRIACGMIPKVDTESWQKGNIIKRRFSRKAFCLVPLIWNSFPFLKIVQFLYSVLF